MSRKLYHNCVLHRPSVAEPPQEHGWILVEQGRIKRLGRGPLPGAEETVDLGGQRVLPGLVNAHTHLYSSLAGRMPWPERRPRDFIGILKQIWWRLDRALDAEAIRVSARVGLADAIRSGCTTVIDHHSSPSYCEGSLDIIAEEAQALGLKVGLAYEVSDRNGEEAFEDGVDENLRGMSKYAKHDTLRGMFGLHASFTLSDESLDSCLEVIPFETPFHLHCAEALLDLEDARRRGYESVVDRLAFLGALRGGSILAHGVHLGPGDLELLAEIGAFIAHCPRSNAHNGVGRADAATMLNKGAMVGLGSDGWLGGLGPECEAAYETGKTMGGLKIEQMDQMLFEGGAAIASALFGRQVGYIEEEADADFVVLSGEAGPPGTGVEVLLVVSRGEVVCENGAVAGVDAEALEAEAQATAERIWKNLD